MKKKQIQISISNNEALVLYDLLSRFSDTDKLTIEHQAEKQTLWNLTCLLEKELAVPFQADYRKSLQSAREKLQFNGK